GGAGGPRRPRTTRAGACGGPPRGGSPADASRLFVGTARSAPGSTRRRPGGAPATGPGARGRKGASFWPSVSFGKGERAARPAPRRPGGATLPSSHIDTVFVLFQVDGGRSWNGSRLEKPKTFHHRRRITSDTLVQKTAV